MFEKVYKILRNNVVILLVTSQQVYILVISFYGELWGEKTVFYSDEILHLNQDTLFNVVERCLSRHKGGTSKKDNLEIHR